MNKSEASQGDAASPESRLFLRRELGFRDSYSLFDVVRAFGPKDCDPNLVCRLSSPVVSAHDVEQLHELPSQADWFAYVIAITEMKKLSLRSNPCPAYADAYNKDGEWIYPLTYVGDEPREIGKPSRYGHSKVLRDSTLSISGYADEVRAAVARTLDLFPNAELGPALPKTDDEVSRHELEDWLNRVLGWTRRCRHAAMPGLIPDATDLVESNNTSGNNDSDVSVPLDESANTVVVSKSPMLVDSTRPESGTPKLAVPQWNSSEASQDGPIPGGLRYEGREYRPLSRMPWRLLEYLWAKGSNGASFDDVAEHVWGDSQRDGNDAKSKFRGPQSIANSFFRDKALPFEISADPKPHLKKLPE